MIGMIDIRQYFRILQAGFQVTGRHAIVDTPSFIVLPGLEAITPPGILPTLIMEITEGVDKTRVDEMVNPLPLLRKLEGRVST